MYSGDEDCVSVNLEFQRNLSKFKRKSLNETWEINNKGNSTTFLFSLVLQVSILGKENKPSD